MAEIALATTVPDPVNRPFGYGSTDRQSLSFAANTAAEVRYFLAPSAGVLKAFYVQASVTSDVTKTYTITCTNVSNASAAMLGTTVYDADPVLTAGTVAAATLSTTAANLVVDKGDLIGVSMTGGTGSGQVAIEAVFEVA